MIFIKWLGRKLGSRKFHVFVLASFFLGYGKIGQVYWFFLAVLYISTNIFLRVMELWWSKKDKNE